MQEALDTLILIAVIIILIILLFPGLFKSGQEKALDFLKLHSLKIIQKGEYLDKGKEHVFHLDQKEKGSQTIQVAKDFSNIYYFVNPSNGKERTIKIFLAHHKKPLKGIKSQTLILDTVHSELLRELVNRRSK